MGALQTDISQASGAYRERAREVVRSFAPDAPEWERAGHLPRALFTALGSAGIFRDRWRHGAVSGLPFARAMVEELALVNGGAALAVSIHSEVFVNALYQFGGSRHHEVLQRALGGEAVGCIAATEAGGGSDLAAIRVQATRTTSGWHLDGAKCFTTNAGRASHALVLARTAGHGQEFTLFLVPLDAHGVRIKGFFNTLGVRSADTAAIEFDVDLPESAVVGRPGSGMFFILKVLDFERVAAATGLVAGARYALGLAVAYMRDRTQFGKRLFDHQALRHRLTDRWAEVEAAAALLDRACEPVRGTFLGHHQVAAAKLVAARSCGAAIDEVLQVFGARGFTEAYPLERMYRDARLTRIGGGTDEVLREIISLHLDVEHPGLRSALDELRRNDGTP